MMYDVDVCWQMHGCNCPGASPREMFVRLRHNSVKSTRGFFLRLVQQTIPFRHRHPHRPAYRHSTCCILYGCTPTPVQMTICPMRRFSSSARTRLPFPAARSLTAPRLLGLRQYQRSITDIRPRQASVSRSWFTSSSPWLSPELDEREKKRLAERNLKLGDSMASLVI